MKKGFNKQQLKIYTQVWETQAHELHNEGIRNNSPEDRTQDFLIFKAAHQINECCNILGIYI